MSAWSANRIWVFRSRVIWGISMLTGLFDESIYLAIIKASSL